VVHHLEILLFLSRTISMTDETIKLPQSSRVRNRATATKVLYMTSDEAGMTYPTSANIARELYDDDADNSLVSSVSHIMLALERNGFLEDREVAGSNRPYQPTDLGQRYLEQNREVFEDLLEE
jgi:hypothetical protein